MWYVCLVSLAVIAPRPVQIPNAQKHHSANKPKSIATCCSTSLPYHEDSFIDLTESV